MDRREDRGIGRTVASPKNDLFASVRGKLLLVRFQSGWTVTRSRSIELIFRKLISVHFEGKIEAPVFEAVNHDGPSEVRKNTRKDKGRVRLGLF